MLEQITGINSVHKLYLQLLYKCNFNCTHCFHGTNLQRSDRFSLEEIELLLRLFTSKFGTKCLTLLGGEPFLYKEISRVLDLAKVYELETEVCTNGYKISKILSSVGCKVDLLRVSIEGLQQSNDNIRKQKSFKEAIKSLCVARDLGISTSVTTTVTRSNAYEIYNLAKILEKVGVDSIKLHELRKVGNAKMHPELFCDEIALRTMAEQVARVQQELTINIFLDDGLDTSCAIHSQSASPIQKELERIEVQPDGGMYVSCKAVGSNSNAFWFNKLKGEIEYQPTDSDELKFKVPQVQYFQLNK